MNEQEATGRSSRQLLILRWANNEARDLKGSVACGKGKLHEGDYTTVRGAELLHGRVRRYEPPLSLCGERLVFQQWGEPGQARKKSVRQSRNRAV
ncbi:MAG TPA: hypothetical protein VJM31_11340 [Vicinamibacterales bacterium]|nr:hypothetical protein [Vicinamibacterales bacterium]